MAQLIREMIEDVNVIAETTEGSDRKKYYVEGVFIQGNSPNRNKRIYPMNVLEKEVNRYTKECINENRALGELGHPCLDDKAEVLTQNRGWKLIRDLIIGEDVYTLNPHTQTIEFNSVKDIHINHYTGKMLRLKSRMFDTLVTPYHRFLTYYRDGKPYTITAGEIKEFMDNNISKLSKFAIPKTGDYKEKSPENINMFGYELNFKNFVAFLSLYLAEGSTTKRNNSYRISITQNKGEKSDKIISLLESLPFKYNRYERINKFSGNIGYVWTFDNEKELGVYLNQFGKSYEKYIDPKILSLLDEETSTEFLKWYVLGDGRGNFEKKYTKTDVFSTSKNMIEGLTIVAVKSGHTFKCYEQIEENDIIIENRVIKAASKRPLYFMNILRSEYVWLDKRHIKIEEVDWDDKVYCITTENSNFLVRHNGYSFWSGNCGPNINLDRVSHLITSLRKEGNDYIGKAKILDTPNGRIVESFLKENIKIGMSTRALGSLIDRNGLMEVQDDLRFTTAGDIVADPSAQRAFMNGIYENAEWVFNPATNSWQTMKLLEDTKKSGKILNEAEIYKIFHKYITNLSK
jgi:intein/homing endonuclease